MTDLTPEQRAELRAKAEATIERGRAWGTVTCISVLPETVLALLDQLERLERERDPEDDECCGPWGHAKHCTHPPEGEVV